MYSYHNRILQRIRNGEWTGVKESTDERFAFVLLFSTPPYTRPIRPHAAWRYHELLGIVSKEENRM